MSRQPTKRERRVARGRNDLLEDLAEPLDPLHAGELLRSHSRQIWV